MQASGHKIMRFKYKVGDTCYIASRYDGLKKRTIVALVEFEGRPCYELDRLVQVHKDGHAVGAAEYSEAENFYGTVEWEAPCGEHLLMQVGDPLQTPVSMLFGTKGLSECAGVLTQEIVDGLA